jgi:Fe-S-cluster containining protein
MKRFVCKRCGACCQGESTVSLTEEDVLNIANYLGLSVENFLKEYTIKKGENRLEMRVVNNHCIFFDEKENLCLIHPVKPKPCKDWPFPRAIWESEENFNIIKESCPALSEFSYEDLLSLRCANPVE